MITLDNVTKRYYSLVAVDGISFTLPRGQVLGILGPNGAGKTTLFRLIAGLLQPDSGEIRPTHNHWPAIGYKPERLLFPNQMRVDDYLKMVGRLANLTAGSLETTVQETLEQVKLSDAARKRIGECSKGMRQRLAIGQSLIGSPPLVLLDEPSNGLDPEGQSDVRRLIRRLGAGGQTIVMSSHHLEEVTQTCDYLIILKQGKIHYRSTMVDALSLRPHVTIQVDDDLQPAAPMFTSMHPDVKVEGTQLILINEAIQLRRHILSLLVGIGYDIVSVNQKRATLEDIYAEAVQWHDES